MWYSILLFLIMPFTFPETIVKNPLTMLCFYDEDINTGVVKLSDWQREFLVYFGKEHKDGSNAVQAMLLAANGSGKSQFILAPCSIWLGMKYPESLAIITTASGNQLDAQDLRYCTRLAKRINKAHEKEFPEGIIECNYRKFYNKVTESYLNLFATDETGKAEGWHPIKPFGKFAIFVDEGKTVNDEIYDALERCTGYTHRLEISSSGKSSGRFYSMWHTDLEGVLKRRITAFDCPHIPIKEIEQKIKKYGLHDPLIRSSIFSEFTSTDQQVVISRELLIKSSNICDKFYDFGPLRAGLDLAAGGDENSISVWKGNKEIATKSFKQQDTSKTVIDIIEFIDSFNGNLKSENIWADDGGVGRGILDNFREKGYKFNRVLNQSRAFDTTHYANRGSELWFNFKRFIEEYQVLFLKNEKGDIDSTLLSQLSNRYYKIQQMTGKIQLESKQIAKKEGHPSPDRADGVVLAWSPYVYPLVEINGTGEIVDKKVYTPEDWYLEQRNKEMALMRNQNSDERKFKTTYQPHQLRASSVLSYRNIYKNRLASKS